MSIPRPASHEYAPFYARYIEKVPEGDLPALLEGQAAEVDQLLASLSEAQALHRYAPGKWSIKEMVGHLADAERIMTYRLLRIARGDATPLAGFEEDDYVRAAGFDRRTLTDLRAEFQAVRRATLALIRSLDAEAFARRGTANQNPVTAAALAHILFGHTSHHMSILRDRYLA
jgi:uncharacterized damage-inducible protein DinB